MSLESERKPEYLERTHSYNVHASTTLKELSWDPNLEPYYSDATVLSTTPLCRPIEQPLISA